MSTKEQQAQKPKSKTAAQRIEQLENAFMSLYQTADNMARDLLTTKEAIKLLGNKVDAIVKVVRSGGELTDDNISAGMIENNVEELKNRVDRLAKAGVLTKEDQVNENSFVVGREMDQDNTIVNPRLQFALKAMPVTTQEKIKGAKPGDIITIEEGKLRFELLETYSVTPPKPELDPQDAGRKSAETSASLDSEANASEQSETKPAEVKSEAASTPVENA